MIKYEKILMKINEYLEEMGIEVEQIHKEAGPGQFELCIKYERVMRCIDNYLLARTVISREFDLAGFKVSYLPITFKDGIGNGAHVHMSLWTKDSSSEKEKNITGDLECENNLGKVAQ